MKDLRPRGIAATSGVRMPASLRRSRNVDYQAGQRAANKTTTDFGSAAGQLLSETGVETPEVSSLTLLILSWMHRRNLAVAQTAYGTKVR